MFDYDLKDKQVILVLADEVVEKLRPLGVAGSPVLGTVHKVESHGLWLDSPQFSVCPVGASKLVDAKGDSFCHAHVFIPAGAIISAVAFPSGAAPIEDQPGLHRIGFTPAGD